MERIKNESPTQSNSSPSSTIRCEECARETSAYFVRKGDDVRICLECAEGHPRQVRGLRPHRRRGPHRRRN